MCVFIMISNNVHCEDCTLMSSVNESAHVLFVEGHTLFLKIIIRHSSIKEVVF